MTLTHEAQCNPLQDCIEELVTPLEVSGWFRQLYIILIEAVEQACVLCSLATWLSVEWQSLLNEQGGQS